ncbi:MAG: zinc-ribbon domain-containing protein, partial [Alphaproteobacteria bacterium]|nr:zinc-ribbon domain-containing protein [Alphaproteobacteria bacterium]
MLISCPKCHSVYEVPDSLVPKTGQNFRCSACSNVWNVIKSDALGYRSDAEDEMVVEAIEVNAPPLRNFPSDKKEYIIVNDRSPKVVEDVNWAEEKNVELEKEIKVETQKEIQKEVKVEIEKQTDKNMAISSNESQVENELILTSDQGTSFTISMGNGKDDKKKYFEEEGIKADIENRLMVQKKKNWYVKTRCFLYILFFVLGLILFRSGVVLLFDDAEKYYNKIGLSGYNNYHNLKFLDVKVFDLVENGKDIVKIVGEIKNDGIFATKVLDVGIRGENKRFKPNNMFLKAKEKTLVEISLPKDNNTYKVYRV